MEEAGMVLAIVPTQNLETIAILLEIMTTRSEIRACIGAPAGIRTPNLLIRSQMLYPVELRAQVRFYFKLLILYFN